MSASELAAVVGGTAIGHPGATATSFTIDSRLLEPGACFVAVRGVRDGHEFVADAFSRGAAVALVSRAVAHPPEGALVIVDDPLAALGRAAAHARAARPDLTVVGITGSAGKTVTKDLTAAALAPGRRVHASPGSFNNEAGLPLTLLSVPAEVDVVVAEMGARFRGNIADLSLIARPDVGVVTHIGLAHAEHLGGREGVLATKGELVEALPASGTAVLNADDDATAVLRARTDARVITVGTAADADVVVEQTSVDVELRPRFRLVSPWGSADVVLAVRGAHQAPNAAMAATVACVLGVALEDAVAGLADSTTAGWRMQLEVSPGDVIVLNDAYNASPSSMHAALRSLAALSPPGRRVAVLGDMLELGPHAADEHAALGALAHDAGVELLIAVGPHSAAAADEATRKGITALTAADRDEALVLARRNVRPGDAVLVKASRAMGLESVAEALLRGEHDQ